MLCGILVAILTTLVWQTKSVHGSDCIIDEQTRKQLEETKTNLNKCVLIEIIKPRENDEDCPDIRVDLGVTQAATACCSTYLGILHTTS
ncbi:hypothetical protein Y032_0006g2818 [Ancylostoma ceylanicum]|uniref:Uncharacterized protein n=1 Tax=Ancylostoma ceylanicum TaxID=53326 RepID=A0A016VQY6_9BILA|nr:hypothetical protein Y032_0006g2818 [Ancylostoma ceylanicum]